MKRLAFLSFGIAVLLGPIQLQAQQYDSANHCVRFPQIPNPEAELRYLLSNPNIPVCQGPHPDPSGQAETVRRGMNAGYDNTMGIIRAQRGY